MSGAVLYRKWRPADFDQVVGQEPVVRTLRNAVAQDKIAHAYLFCGPRGTGKTTTARILARAINGQTGPNGVALLSDGDGLGFDLIEIDAASNRGIDDIRELRERANYQPGSARFKVYLIDEVHQLTGAAADALLKTLEEPPPHVVFILATTDPEALKPTILSRCQRFDFRRVSVDAMVGRLRAIADSEGIAIPDEALRLIAREATGSLRDAVNLLDQVWTTCGDEISVEAAQEALGLSPDARALELASAALKRDLKAGLAVLGAVQSEAVDFQRFKRQVVTHLRHVLLVLTGAAETLALSDPEEEQLRSVCQGVEPSAAVAALRAFSDADVRTDPYQPLPLELALANIVYGPAAVRAVMPVDAAVTAQTTQPQRRRSRAQQDSQRRGTQRRRQTDDGRRHEPAAGERPQPSATETSPAPARSTSQTRGEDRWDRLLEAIRSRLANETSFPRWALVGPKIVSESDDALVIGFPPTYQTKHMQLANDAVADISKVASQVLQREIRLQCIAIDDVSSAQRRTGVRGPSQSNGGGADRAPDSGRTARPKPGSVMVEDARKRFGARPVGT